MVGGSKKGKMERVVERKRQQGCRFMLFFMPMFLPDSRLVGLTALQPRWFMPSRRTKSGSPTFQSQPTRGDKARKSEAEKWRCDGQVAVLQYRRNTSNSREAKQRGVPILSNYCNIALMSLVARFLWHQRVVSAAVKRYALCCVMDFH